MVKYFEPPLSQEMWNTKEILWFRFYWFYSNVNFRRCFVRFRRVLLTEASYYTLSVEAPVSLTILLTKYKLTLCHNPENRTVKYSVIKRRSFSLTIGLNAAWLCCWTITSFVGGEEIVSCWGCSGNVLSPNLSVTFQKTFYSPRTLHIPKHLLLAKNISHPRRFATHPEHFTSQNTCY